MRRSHIVGSKYYLTVYPENKIQTLCAKDVHHEFTSSYLVHRDKNIENLTWRVWTICTTYCKSSKKTQQVR